MNNSKNILNKSNSNKIINSIPKNNSQENQSLSISKLVHNNSIPVNNNSSINKSIPKPDNNNLSINKSIPIPVNNNSGINKSIPIPVNNNSGINKSIPVPVNNNSGINKSIPKPVNNNSGINKSIPVPVNNNSGINKSIPVAVNNNSGINKSIPKPVSTNTTQNRSILNNKSISNTDNSNAHQNKSISNTDNFNTLQNKSIVNNRSNLQNKSNSNNNCPHNSCPYLPRKVVTEKQAEKEPIGSFYHPTKKTYRTGACEIGYVLKRGYERESYTKKDGTIINETYVDPVCIKNKGLNGKLLEEYKPIHLDNKIELSVYGYETKLKIHERLNALIKAVEKLTYKSVILRISALRTLHKNNPHYFKLFDKDLKNVQLLHSLYEFGYKINSSDSRRIISLKKASEKLTFKKVLSILKKLRNIYKTDEVFQNIFNKDILMLEEYYKK